MKRVFFATSLLTSSLFCFGQIKTQPLSTSIDPLAGIPYCLPKTTLRIEVETRKIVEKPGKYFPYAERYLGLTNICQTENVRYEIVGIQVSAEAVPDLQNTYLISDCKGKLLPSIEQTSDGFLKSIGHTSNNGMKNKTVEKDTAPACTENYRLQRSSIITQEMQQASSTAKMAEIAANQLFNLRETRLNLLTQDLEKTPADGRSYEIILRELKRMEQYYLELFTGEREETTETTVLEYDPQKNGEEILFRFSQLKGILEKTNLGGDPIYINLQKVVGTLADVVKTSGGETKKKNKNGFSIYYRIPGKAQIKITNGTSTLCSKELPVAQFGKVTTLPFGTLHSADFCPLTGAIVRTE